MFALPAILAAGGCGGSDDSSSSTEKKTAPTKTEATKTQGTKTQAAEPSRSAGQSVPVKVLREKGAVRVVAEVTIRGKSFAMVLDTGATQTVIDARAAKKLGLADSGPARTTTTLGCRTRSQPASISDWKTGPVDLPDGTVVTKKTDDYEKTKGKIIGLLGADALASFGSLRVDYQAQRLTLGGPAPDGAESFRVKVVTQKGNVLIAAPISLRGKTLAVVLDTGAAKSTLDLATAKKLGLKTSGKATKVSAVNCAARVQPIRIKGWKLGGVALPPTLGLGSGGSLTKKGIYGLLGSDVFARFGTVFIDFKGSKAALR